MESVKNTDVQSNHTNLIGWWLYAKRFVHEEEEHVDAYIAENAISLYNLTFLMENFYRLSCTPLSSLRFQMFPIWIMDAG